MAEEDSLVEVISRLRSVDAGFVFENRDRGVATVGTDVRVLSLRHNVEDAFGALDRLADRWGRLTAALGLADDTRLAFYLGYESQARTYERDVPSQDAFPEACVMVPRNLVLVDTSTQTVRRVGLPWSEGLLGDDFELLSGSEPSSTGEMPFPPTSREEYIERVQAIQTAIQGAEIEQVVISMTQTFDDAAVVEDLYIGLRTLNPSPQMFLMKGPGFAFAGSSPLRMFELRGRALTVETDGGTRPLATGGDDAAWVPTPKEKHEHELLVDALLSDIKSVVLPGSMTAGESLVERKFSHVRHLFASARGTVAASVTAGELLRSMSPHGAVTGAPRAGAIKVIARVEGSPRGPYGGVVGVMGPGTDMDVACVIRSFILTNGMVAVQTGAGIVEQSDAEDEYQECLDKAQALVDVLDSVRSRA